LGFLLAACGPRRITLPADPGMPLPDYAAVHAQVSAACAGVRTLTAELGLSGEAGGERLRGRVIAGFERPASMRLEAPAPFGPPVFILAVRAGNAVLLFPRDPRVLRNASPQEILAALTGVNLAPADLQAILTGCVVPSPRPTAGRLHANGWASIDLETGSPADSSAKTGSSVFLRRAGNQWQVVAARRDGWQVEYPEWQGRFPAAVRLRSAGGNVQVDLTTTISQLATNIDLEAAAFTVDTPPDAKPLSLAELRAAGPLRGN
jgi:hypothetical protein